MSVPRLGKDDYPKLIMNICMNEKTRGDMERTAQKDFFFFSSSGDISPSFLLGLQS